MKKSFKKRFTSLGEELFGECPEHGGTMECKETRRQKLYRRRRFHCMIPKCKYRATTVEVLVPELVASRRRSGIADFIKEVVTA